jgi:putative ABC transport system permease protein
VAGSPETAVAAMRKGHACVVPDHFLRETELKLGDTFALVPPDDPDHPTTYAIAGAVRLPGWHWLTKRTGFRTRTHRAAALVFADYASVAADFGLSSVRHVWLSYSSPDADPQQIAAGAQELYRAALGRDVGIGRSPDDGPSVQIMPVETIRQMTRDSAKRWLWVIGQIPLVALGISCIGVLNVMLASVRARRWDFGVLRAIGFTRGALIRAILAEGLLIGVVAGLLSLACGVVAGWCGCGIAQYASFFGGMNPALVVPAGPVVRGMLALAVLMTFTAVWPALSMGRTRPLSLLQQGRGTF